MSQMKAFIEKANSDESLTAKLNELGEKDIKDEEIIALAAEYGFTITKDEIENMRFHSCNSCKSCEIQEEELESVAGGGMPTQNRWNPKICPTLTRTRYECVGFLNLFWCDHYEMKDTKTTVRSMETGLEAPIKIHICKRGAFNYWGSLVGDPWPPR